MNATGFCFFSIICLSLIGKSIAQERRIVCYYTNWSVYRGTTASFTIENISPTPCTHLLYAYARITDENTIEPIDSYQDLRNGGYSKFTGLKRNNNNLKTLLSIRSNDDTSKFSPLVGNETRKPIFIENAISYLRQYNFDGLDLNWQHPTYGNVSQPEDRINYAKFVQQLREAFEWDSSTKGQTRLLLSLTIPQFPDIIDQGYDVEKLSQYSDWLNIVAHNYYNDSSPTANNHASLYAIDGQDSRLNVNFSVNYLISAGADREKLVIGIPTYGRSYTLLNSSLTGVGAPTTGPGKPGNGTEEAGTLAYFEICQNIISNSNWTVTQPNDNASGPYLYKDDQWIGYDDEKSVQNKAQYVVKEGLGGVMFWTVDLDDFHGSCSGKPFPLIEAAREALFDTLGVKTAIAKPSPKPTVSTLSKTLIKSETDFQCATYGFFPHPTDCKKYVFCKLPETSNVNLVPHELTCPANLLFNAQTNVCDYARKVFCTNSNTSAITTQSTPTTKLPTTQRITTPRSEEDRVTEGPGELKKMSSDMLEKLSKTSANNLPTPENIKSDTLRISEAIQSDGGLGNLPKLIKILEDMSQSVTRPKYLSGLNTNQGVSGENDDAAINGKHVNIHIHNSNVLTWLALYL